MEQEFEKVTFIGRNPLLYILPEYESRVFSRRKDGGRLISVNSSNCFAAFPMIAYKVIMPMPEEHKLNLFQLAVLRLMRIKNYSNQELSDKLCIKETLVDLIIKQLIRREYLTEYRSITKSGEDAASGAHKSEKNLLGYVFYNVITESFEDCFLEEKKYRVFEYKYNGFMMEFNALTDISGNDMWIKAYDLNEAKTAAVTPPPLTQRDAYNICSSAIKRFYSANDPNAGIGDQQETGIDISRFSVDVVSKPRACYVVTVAYRPDEKGSVWTVSDPFALRPSEKLRQCLYEIDNPKLRERLKSLDRGAGTAANFDFTEYNKEERSQLKALMEKVKSLFGSAAVEDAFCLAAAKAIVAYNRLNSEARLSPAQYEREIERYVDNCYQMLEQALNKCQNIFTEKIKQQLAEFSLDDYFTSDSRTNAQNLADLAFGVMGFSNDTTLNVDAVFRVSRVSMRENKDERDMQELIAANLILAKNCAEHPFRSADGKKDFISDAAMLKAYRDPIRHEYRLDFAFEDVKEYLQKTLDYSAWLLSAEKYDAKAAADLPEKVSVSFDIEQDGRLLNDCLNEIAGYGIDVAQYSQNAALKLLQKALYCDKKGDADGFITNSASLFEEILRCYRNEVHDEEVSRYIDDKVLLDQVTVMKELCGDEGLQCLPASSVYFNRFFEHAGIFHFKKNPPCSSALFQALVCAKSNSKGEFAGFIHGNVSFVEDLCFIHIKRGHSLIKETERAFDRKELVGRLIGYVKRILN